MKLFYDVLYCHFRAPWDIGPRSELVALVSNGRLSPCRAVDLGCGTGANAIFLAQHGFDVTGIDFSQPALALAKKRSKEAGVGITLLQDDLTSLQRVEGTFDLVVDYGALDDLMPNERDAYAAGLLRLTHAGSLFLLWGFEYHMRWWERFIPFFPPPFAGGEVHRRFADFFEIEEIKRSEDPKAWPPGYAAYLMARRPTV